MPSSLPLCLVLGPNNSGSSRIARFLTNALLHTTHVDGKLDLSPATVNILGDHRNELCMGNLESIFLTHPEQIPIVSMSPGVMLDRKSNPALLSNMKTVFGPETEFNIIIFLPRDYGSSEPLLVLEGDEKDRYLSDASPLCADLRALYLSKAENPADEKKRLEMHTVLLKLIKSLADVCGKIVFFPTAVEEISESHQVSLVESLRSLAPPRIEGTPHFIQKRFLTEHGVGDEKKVHHITIDFNSAGVSYKLPLSDPLQAHVGATVTGRLMTCPSTGLLAQLTESHRVATTILADASLQALIPSHLPLLQVQEALQMMCSSIDRVMGDFGLLQDTEFVKSLNTYLGKYRIILETYKKANQDNDLTALLRTLEEKKWLKVEPKGQIIQFIVFPGLFQGELGTRAHITVNYGPHKPADMRTAAQCVYSGAATIRIDACEYRYNTGKDIPVEILRIYYI